MFRYGRLGTALALLIAILGAGLRFAFADPVTTARLTLPIRQAAATFRATSAPTPVTVPSMPLGKPFGRLAQVVRRRGSAITTADLARHGITVPSLAQAMRSIKGKRAIRSGSGATVVLQGTQTPTNGTAFTYVYDQSIAYATTANLLCAGLPANKNNAYYYFVLPPKYLIETGNAGVVFNGTAISTNAAGVCTGTQGVNFSTPWNSATPTTTGTDAAYPGIWTVGIEDTAGNFVAASFIVVLSQYTVNTSSDSAGSNITQDFTAGSTVYFTASGLSTTDNYALGYNQTSGNIKCVYTLPQSATPYNTPCLIDKGVTGYTASNGTFTAAWPTTAATGTGTYSIVLFDLTTGVQVAQQQISVQSATNTPTWKLTPYNGATAGTDLNDTFAFDGFLDTNGY